MNKEKIIIELEKQINERRNEIKDEKNAFIAYEYLTGYISGLREAIHLIRK